jgi:membrane protein
MTMPTGDESKEPGTKKTPSTAPQTSTSVSDQIESVVERVEAQMTFSRLGPVGLVLLAWSAITLLTTIERSLNRIFEARESRPLVSRVLLYWSAVTFVPIILVASEFLVSQATRAAMGIPALKYLVVAVALLSSLIVGTFLLALFYTLMTNTRVRFRSALLGAAIVVPLWTAARWGFGIYVDIVVGTGSLYGTLGLLPVFMLWINLCWYFFLFGAALAYTHINLPRLRVADRSRNVLLGPMDALAVLVALCESYARGRGPVTLDGVIEQLALPEDSVRQLIDRLAAAGWVCPVESPADAYLPTMPTNLIRVNDVLDASGLADSGGSVRSTVPRIVNSIQKIHDLARQSVGNMTIADLLSDK